MSYALLIVKNGIRVCPFISVGMYKPVDPTMFQSSQLYSCIEGRCQGEIMYQLLLCIVFLVKRIWVFGLDRSSSRHQTERQVPRHSPAAYSRHQPLARSLPSIAQAGKCAERVISYFLLAELPMGAVTPFLVFLRKRVGGWSSKRHGFLLFVWMPTETSWMASNLL